MSRKQHLQNLVGVFFVSLLFLFFFDQMQLPPYIESFALITFSIAMFLSATYTFKEGNIVGQQIKRLIISILITAVFVIFGVLIFK